jgi:hypothetical protein
VSGAWAGGKHRTFHNSSRRCHDASKVGKRGGLELWFDQRSPPCCEDHASARTSPSPGSLKAFRHRLAARPQPCTSPARRARYNGGLACGIIGFSGHPPGPFLPLGTFALGEPYLRMGPLELDGLGVSKADWPKATRKTFRAGRSSDGRGRSWQRSYEHLIHEDLIYEDLEKNCDRCWSGAVAVRHRRLHRLPEP